MKIGELLDSIAKRDLVLPEFQREYVWGKEQAKQLMVSLVKEYPVGGLLFWKTDKPPELKNVTVLPERLGTVQVILDGQQRLTTLYMLLRGEIPPYYREVDITNDPRDLYYNLENGDFQYYQPTRMKDNPIWIRVIDCFMKSDLSVFEIARQNMKDGDDPFTLAKVYNDNLTKLRNAEKDDLPVQSVPSHASMEDSIDIFDRVNSQGTKLTDAELALTHVTGKWAQARRVFKQKLEQFNHAHFYFDLAFLTRALTGVVCQRALFETIHPRPRADLEAGWKQLSDILDYIVPVLSQRGFIDSTRDMNTNNVLVPLVVYLSLNGNKFPNDTSLKHALHWLYTAQTWSRYTSQTDQRLEHDVSLVVRESSPWNALRDRIIDQRGRLDVKADDMDGRGIQHPLYNMAFILAKAQGAVDWFTGAPLGAIAGKSYNLQNSYVFHPQLLYGNGYESENHMHRKIVGEIANRVVLVSTHPYHDKSPEEYFPRIEENYPGALKRQFIPIDPTLWRLDRFADFLAARRELIANKINEYMKALISEIEIVHERPISELIKLGESATLEFKSTWQWDIVKGDKNKELRREGLKTIVAFLNSNGGTLLIGVEDNGNLFGLERDLENLNRKDEDGFLQELSSAIHEFIGSGYSPYIKIRFEQLNSHKVCVVDVERSSEPAYFRGPNGQEFYARLASTSRKLDAEETVRYIQANW